jgi:hypothetical protein
MIKEREAVTFLKKNKQKTFAPLRAVLQALEA